MTDQPAPQTPVHKKFLRPSDVMELYGISRATLSRWVINGKIPQPTRITKRFIGWTPDTIEAVFRP